MQIERNSFNNSNNWPLQFALNVTEHKIYINLQGQEEREERKERKGKEELKVY